MSDESRREFLTKAAAVAPAAVILGTASNAAAAPQMPGRRVVPGAATAPFSRAVVLGDLAFVAGVLGRKENSSELASADFEPQCRQAFQNLLASVEAAGSSMGQVLKCTCFLTDVADFPTMNKVFREFFATEPPARSTVVVKELVVTGAKIEVDCVTALPPRR